MDSGYMWPKGLLCTEWQRVSGNFQRVEKKINEPRGAFRPPPCRSQHPSKRCTNVSTGRPVCVGSDGDVFTSSITAQTKHGQETNGQSDEWHESDVLRQNHHTACGAQMMSAKQKKQTEQPRYSSSSGQEWSFGDLHMGMQARASPRAL